MEVPLRILIVEDNESDLELIIRELKNGSFEFEYEHCQTENTFDESLIKFKPDLILSDHNLPSFNSLDALKKAREFNTLIPFILVSGFIGEEEAVDMIVNKGANDFILKDNLVRMNPSIIREINSYRLKSELHNKNQELHRLSMVASHTNNGVLITNNKSEIEWVNSAFEKLSGYTLDECLGKKPEDFLRGKDTNKKTISKIEEKLRKLNPVKEELLNYRKDGIPYWVKLDMVPILDEQGELRHFIEVHEDITEAKEHELLLVAINDITTSLLDTDSFAEICHTITKKLIHHFGFDDCVIYEVDKEKNTLVQVAATGSKRSNEKTIKNPLVLNFGEGIVGSVAKSKKAEIVTDTSKDDRYVIGNEKRQSELTVPIILDDEVIGVIDSEHLEKNFYTEKHLMQFETVAGVIASKFKAAQENSLKKLAEEELRKSEEQLSQITSNIDVAVHRYEISNDGTGRLTYVSPRSYDIFEIEPEMALRDDSLILDQIFKEDRKKADTIFENALSKKNENVFQFIFRIKTPSGKIKWVEVNGTITYKKDNTIVVDTINKDITKRVEAEKAVVKNEQLLSSLTNNIPGVIIRFVLDEEKSDRIEFISEGCEKLYEVSAKDILKDKTKLWELVFPEDVGRMVQEINKSAQELTPFIYEYRIKTKSSKVKWLRASGSPRKKENNTVIWDTVVLDITKEKEFENSLIDSNIRLLEAQSLAQIGDWLIDFEKNETFISPTVRKILGADPALEFDIEQGLSFFKEGFNRERKRLVMEKAIADGTPYSEELQIVTPNGELKWVRSIGQAEHKNGICTRIFGTIMDITTEKEKELVLKKNEERLEAAVNGAELGQWDMNYETGEHHVNEQCFKMLGYSSSDVESGYDFFFSILHPEDAHIPQQEIQRIEEGGENNLDSVLRLKNSEGYYQRILARGKIVEFDEQGKAKRLVGTHLDVTKSLELQESLTKSLNEKTVLLAEIHHRVKNNLAIVSGLLDLQAMESKNELLRDTLFNMAQRIKSIAGVHELLYGEGNFSEIPFNTYLNELIKKLNTGLLHKKNVALNLSIDQEVSVNINQAVPVGLLLNELITNSFKHAFNDVENPRIKLSFRQKDGTYHVEYSDNGSGVCSTEIEKPKTLGMTLINTLLAQLNADYNFENKQGFILKFNFEEQNTGSHSRLVH